MKFRKITVGLCALMCFSALAGCKDRSEMPPLDDSSATVSSAESTYSSSTENSASGGAVTSTSSGDTNSSKPAESSAPHVHNYKETDTAGPYCAADGRSKFECECGDSYTVELEATGHDYAKTTVEAGCENGGYTRYTCASCGDSYDEDVIQALGHKWGDWETVKEATTSSAGEKQSSCSRCGETRSESIPKLESSSSSDDFTSEVVRLVNIERANYGLSPLEENSTLEEYAQLRSTEIVSKFSHERPDGTRALEYLRGLGTLRTYGENIAMGQKTPEDVVDAWMNSEGHRANILKSDFTMIGVGCYKSGGAYHWVQIFGG